MSDPTDQEVLKQIDHLLLMNDAAGSALKEKRMGDIQEKYRSRKIVDEIRRIIGVKQDANVVEAMKQVGTILSNIDNFLSVHS